MVSTIIPKVLHSSYFWCIVLLILCIPIYFARKKSPPPFPRVGKFFKKHKRAVTKVSDILCICMILLLSYVSYFTLHTYKMIFSDLSQLESSGTTFVQSDRSFLLQTLIMWTGASGLWIGLFSIFRSNITIIKRIVLLIVCLLPIAFTIIQILMDYTESHWSIIQLCIYSSLFSWTINMPTVLTGKTFFELLEGILKKLKLAPSHHAH